MAYTRRQELTCTEDQMRSKPNVILRENEVIYIKMNDGTLRQKIGDGKTVISALPFTNMYDASGALEEVNKSLKKAEEAAALAVLYNGKSAYAYAKEGGYEGTENQFSVKMASEPFVIPEMFGAKGDGVTDDTEAFKEALAYCDSNEKALKIPSGLYLVTDTLTIKPHTTISGFEIYEWNRNTNTVNPSKGAVILFKPTTEKSLFEIDTSVLENIYVSGICISNLYLVGNDNANIAINFRKATHSTIENVGIRSFKTGLRISYCMLCDFTRLNIQYSKSYSCLIENGLSTALRFHSCYFGQNQASACVPLYVRSGCCNSAVFYSQTFETSPTAAVIESGNTVNLYDLYCENIPKSDASNPVFTVGSETENPMFNTFLNVYSGFMHGYGSQTANSNSVIFRSQYKARVNVTNVNMMYFGQSAESVEGGLIWFTGCMEAQMHAVLPVLFQKNNELSKTIRFENCTVMGESYGNSAYISPIEQKWAAFDSGCYMRSNGNGYTIVISALGGSGNTICKFPAISIPERVCFRLYNMSTLDSYIDAQITSAGTVTALGAVAGVGYKGCVTIDRL